MSWLQLSIGIPRYILRISSVWRPSSAFLWQDSCSPSRWSWDRCWKHSAFHCVNYPPCPHSVNSPPCPQRCCGRRQCHSCTAFAVATRHFSRFFFAKFALRRRFRHCAGDAPAGQGVLWLVPPYASGSCWSCGNGLRPGRRSGPCCGARLRQSSPREAHAARRCCMRANEYKTCVVCLRMLLCRVCARLSVRIRGLHFVCGRSSLTTFMCPIIALNRSRVTLSIRRQGLGNCGDV